MVTIGLITALLLPGISEAHRERPAQFPDGSGSVPEYRTSGPYLLVCNDDTPTRIMQLPERHRWINRWLYAQCRRNGFRHIQAAVNAVTVRGTRILVQPGTYHEEPSLAPLSPECAPLVDREPLSYEQQRACPHALNLIAIFGDGPDDGIACDDRLCDLQIEGTGARPADVVVDNRFQRHIAIRADRTDGVYFRNFTVQHAPDYALYIVETDGYVIDRMLGRWNSRYAFLTFAGDHGRYIDCEAYGNGDSGIYPGAAAPQYGARHAVEITRCRSHHNFAGLGGSAGNSLWVHDNDFYDNTVGIGLDSLARNHPGMPQGHSRIVGNRIHSNNQDFYRYYRDGTCHRPVEERGYDRGVVCPLLVAPVGTGVVVAGGNSNQFQANRIWNNWRYGIAQFWVPARFRGEPDPAKQYDTSNDNRYVANRLGRTPSGQVAPNGVDFWWDAEGAGNCWQDNIPALRSVTSDPAALPNCAPPPAFTPPDQEKVAFLQRCLAWTPQNPDPPGCNWTTTPAQP
jgi:hypothetical protein